MLECQSARRVRWTARFHSSPGSPPRSPLS